MSELSQFSHLHFLRPWWLLAFIPLLITLAYLWSARNPIGRWRKAIAPHLLKVILVRHSRTSWFNPVNVGIFVVFLGVLALAGPTWKQQPSPFSEDIAALVVALDVSSSMEQQDIQPSRLERAKQKVEDLLALRPGGQIGLIVFSGTAHSVIPLTNDPDVVKNFLNAVVNDMMPRQGKFPEKVLPIADKMLSVSPVPGTLLLISDGISPNTVEAYKTYFSATDHQLLVMGIGSETQTINSETNTDGFIPLERASLEKLASEAGGYYQSLSLDKEDVQILARRINNYLVIVDDVSRPWVDAGYYLIFPVAFIMLFWFRKGWTLHWCIAFILVSSFALPLPAMANDSIFGQWRFMDLWLTADQQGMYYLNKGDYKTASARFENIAWRGIAYYRAENFKAATEMFSRIESTEGFFNLGNALAHSRNYLLAVKAYNQALKLEPEHTGALKNRDKIQSIIDEINLLSASQKAEEGDSSKTLGEEDPQTADGAERQDFVEREVEQLTADQILLDEKMNETWMRQVQRDPSQFLGVKFYMQLQGKEASNESP